jgi:uncharacterized protein (DUF58 family)
MAISIGAALVLAADAVVAPWLVRGVVVQIATPPTVTAGRELAVTVSVGRSRPMVCTLGVQHGTRPWIPASVPAEGLVMIEVPRRGVMHRLTVDVRTVGPLGLVSCTRRVPVALAHPLSVGPVPVPAELPQAVAAGLRLDGGGLDDPIGVRPYADGDPRRDVHWLSVARTGTMLVRDRQRRGGDEVQVVVEAARSGDEIEDLLGQVRFVVDQLLAGGYRVWLTTSEGDEGGHDLQDEGARPLSSPVTAPVTGRDELVRRLPRAVEGTTTRRSAPLAGADRIQLVAYRGERDRWRWRRST